MEPGGCPFVTCWEHRIHQRNTGPLIGGCLRTFHGIMGLERIQDRNLACSVYLTKGHFCFALFCFLECLSGLQYGEQVLKENWPNSFILLLKNVILKKKKNNDRSHLHHCCELPILQSVITNHLHCELIGEVLLFCDVMKKLRGPYCIFFLLIYSLLSPYLSHIPLPFPRSVSFCCT